MKTLLTGTHFLRLLRLAAVACLTMPLLTACGGGSGSSSILNLGITDGPVNQASSVVIAFTGVELQPAGGGKAITKSVNATIDLIKEQNGNEASLLSGVSVPAGNYAWIRLMLNVNPDGTVVGSYITINNQQYPLVIPSGAQTGLKLVQGFTMAVGQTADFTIDFMLQQSITAPPSLTTGGKQEYILRPALRLVNNQQVGTISGTVDSTTLQTSQGCLTGANSGLGPLPNANVYIFSGTTLPSIVSGSSPPTPLVEPEIIESSSGYSYSQGFLPTGNYMLAVVCTSTSSGGVTSVVSYFPSGGAPATVTANTTTQVTLPPVP